MTRVALPSNSALPSYSAVLLFTMLSLLGGCKFVGVDYDQPEPALPDQWQQQLEHGTLGGRADLDEWWKLFEDPALDDLLHRSVTSNRGLAAAKERLFQSRVLLGSTRSDLYPEFSGTAGFRRERTSENINRLPLLGGGQTQNYYSFGVEASWELDLLGGVQRAIESSEAELEASEEHYRDVLVLLLSDVATSYIDLCTVEERIRLMRENITIQNESLKIAGDRFKFGLSAKLDVTQAEANLAITRSLLPGLRQAHTAGVNRLAVLIGSHISEFKSIMDKRHSVPVPLKSVEVGLPVEVIRARPDVRTAERKLAAQTARIGVAEADLYPRFSLNGTFELLAIRGGDVFDMDSADYNFGPTLRWNLFNGGRVRSQIAMEESRTREAYHTYENTVLQAVEEVEVSMAAIVNERRRLIALSRGTNASRETVSLVKENYARGLVDFQNVLDAERTLTQLADEQALSKGLLAKAYVRLFKALGAGRPSVLEDAVESEKKDESSVTS